MIALRYDDGVPDLTPAEFTAREAARRADLSDRVARHLPRRHYCAPPPAAAAASPTTMTPLPPAPSRPKNGARTPRYHAPPPRGRPASKVVDLESGATFRDAVAAARDVGPGASPDSVRTMIRNRGSYKGRWFAWWTPPMNAARFRAAELRRRRAVRAGGVRVPVPPGGGAGTTTGGAA